jgi:glucosamine--fructose-6-phosphate aminotransferase (isomerizing)
MCGIIGYIGNKSACDVVLNGLRALEYRGYDSVGIAYMDNHGASKVVKQAGRVEGIYPLINKANLQSHVAIGHTRWATHGSPNIINAHPHINGDGSILVVHNGIIENYLEIKQELTKNGYTFISQTDTEVIPHLIDYYSKHLGTFEDALTAALNDLKGAYAVAVITTKEPDKIYAAKLSSPLVIGVGKHNEYFLASDPNAILEHTKKVVFLEDYDLAIISRDKLFLKDLHKNIPKHPKAELLDYDRDKVVLGDFPNFTLKEIFEAPVAIKAATLGRIQADKGIVKLGGLEIVATQLKLIDRIVIVACGTSYYAGLVGEYLIEEFASIPVEVQLASEFKYRKEPFSRSSVLLTISQSGETADTIAALNKVKDYGCLRLGIVNATGSSVARLTDAGVYCHAGPEQAVASTKAFISQVTVLILIALYLSDGTNSYRKLLKELELLPGKAQKVLDQADKIKSIALKYKNYKDFMYVGRKYCYPCALEGALKLKEISYIHAEGYAAGEMKHGPLALIDKDFPTLALATDSPELDKTISNLEEIKARGGPLVIIASEGNKKITKLADDLIYLPETMEQTQPILSAIVLQLFAYFIAEAKQVDIDRPRNLAKSVTVE